MVSINRQHIGIDLGTHSIKLSLLGEQPEGFYVEQSDAYPVFYPLGDRRYFKELKLAIQHFSEEYELKKLALHFTVAPDLAGISASSTLTLPTTDAKILKKAVKFELNESDIIDNPKDVYYQWSDVETVASTSDDIPEETKIMLTTLEKNLVANLAPLRKLAWRIETLELQTETASRMVQGNAAVIDYGHSATRVYLFKGGVCMAVESLEHSGQSLTDFIQDSLSLTDSDEAQDIKHELSLPYGFLNQSEHTPEVEAIVPLVMEETRDMMSEVKRLIRSFEIRSLLAVEHVYYTGGGCLLQNYIALLSDELGHDIRPLSDGMNPKPTKRALSGDAVASDDSVDTGATEVDDEFSEFLLPTHEELEVEEPEDDLTESADAEDATDAPTRSDRLKSLSPTVPALYDLSVSAMIAQEAGAETDINYAFYLKRHFDFTSVLVAITCMSVALHLGVGYINNIYDDHIAEMNRDVSQQSSAIQQLESERRSLEEQSRDYQTLIDATDGLQQLKQWYSDMLYAIPEVTPQGVVTKHITIEEDTITIDGYAKDYTNVGVFAMGLESYGEVSIDDISDVDDSSLYTFTIQDTTEFDADDALSKSFRMTISE